VETCVGKLDTTIEHTYLLLNFTKIEKLDTTIDTQLLFVFYKIEVWIISSNYP